MVARTPPKPRKMVAPLNPVLLRETVKKVDRCMARLQELQYTISGGTKVISGVSLSPRSTRVYLKTSLCCKQETARIKGSAPRKSPVGKFPSNSGGEWQRMSLPAMLVGETVGEILQASQFARKIVAATVDNKTKKTNVEDPKTPMTQQRRQRQSPENTELKARRKKEKHNKSQSVLSESSSPVLHRARSRINFKVSPPKKREIFEKENRYLANRVSPKNRPWAKKSVLFPNPLFSSADPSCSTQTQKFCRTRSPIIGRNGGNNYSHNNKPKNEPPHKFLIKSPTSASKFQVKIKSPPLVSSLSPTKAKKSPEKMSTAVKLSPTSAFKFQVKIKSPPLVSSLSPTKSNKSPKKMSTAAKLRRSFSPSRLATRLVSPLKSRKSVQKSEGVGLIPGLKQRPGPSVPIGISARRI